MKRITTSILELSASLLIVMSIAGCNNDELEKLKHENTALHRELDTLKVSIQREEAKKKFLGKYVNQEKGFLKHGGALCVSFDFKGETTVVMTNWMGIPYATDYVRDGEIIRVKSKDGDFILTIKDSKTLIGEGWVVGTYVKHE